MTLTYQPGGPPPGADLMGPGDPLKARRIRRAFAMPMNDGDPEGTATSAALAHAQAVAAGLAAQAAVTAHAEEPAAPTAPAAAEPRPEVLTRWRRPGAASRGFRPDPGGPLRAAGAAGGEPGPATRGGRPKAGPWPLVAAAAVAGAVLVSVPLVHKGEQQTTDADRLDRTVPVATFGPGALSADGHSSTMVPYATQQQGTLSPTSGGTAADNPLAEGVTPHPSATHGVAPHPSAGKSATPSASPSESLAPHTPWAPTLRGKPTPEPGAGTAGPATGTLHHESKAVEHFRGAAASPTTQSATAAETPAAHHPLAAVERPAAHHPVAAVERPTVHPVAAVQRPTVHHPVAAVQRPTVHHPVAAVQKPTAQPTTAAAKPAAQPVAAVAKPAASAHPIKAPAQHWGTRVINATTVLSAGQSVSTDHVRLAMTSDGALVVTDMNGTVLWSSHTSGTGNYAVFQGDGNLAVYSPDHMALWTSGSAGNSGAELVLQGDRNVTILSSSGSVVWAAGTQD